MQPVRLMRNLTATGIFKSVAEDVYAHTRFSLAYLDAPETDFYTLWYVPTFLLCPKGTNF
jgi:hypothetical protein